MMKITVNVRGAAELSNGTIAYRDGGSSYPHGLSSERTGLGN